MKKFLLVASCAWAFLLDPAASPKAEDTLTNDAKLTLQLSDVPPPQRGNFLKTFEEEKGDRGLDGFLPGQDEIELASARPAARAYFLLYAAALDQYVTDHASIFASEPVLARMVQTKFRDTHSAFSDYKTQFFPSVPPIVDPNREAMDLRIFLKRGYNGSGYKGRLLNEIQTYLIDLDKAAKAPTPNR